MEDIEITTQEQSFEEVLNRITKILCKALNPEYILLFGSLAGGTPHSKVEAFDLLIITSETPKYDFLEIRQFMKQYLPRKHRGLTSTNIYIYSQSFVNNKVSPFLHLAKQEGRLLYSRNAYSFIRSKTRFNYCEIYKTSSNYFFAFFELGENLLKDAKRSFEENNIRQSIFYISQSAELFYRTLFYVYHGFEVDYSDLHLLWMRMRTISPELCILFDSSKSDNARIKNLLNKFRKCSLYFPRLEIDREDLSLSLEKADNMKKIIEELCKQRLDLYKSRMIK